MSLRRAGCLAVLAVVSVFSFSVRSAESITIKPAAFDHIEADVPAQVMAGVEFEVSVTFVDRFGNPMADNWKPETSLTLHVSQPASVRPSILTPDNYVPGFKYRVHTEKMGELTLSLRDDKGRVMDQWDLTIKSGRPVKLLVDLPPRAEVGETLPVSFQAVDAHGNVAFGYDPEPGSLVLEDGNASLGDQIQPKTGGNYEIPVQFKAQGRQTLTLRDRKRGLSGSSAVVNVTPAPLDAFAISTASNRSTAGQELALTIRAMDRYGNLLADYNERYKGVRLYSGDAAVAPDLVPPNSFSGGVARVGIVMRKAGDHVIKVSELQSNISGDFRITVVPADVRSLTVVTPESATAGESFEITITLQDQFGNRTPSIASESIVRLKSTGTGNLNPDSIKGSAFRDGLARIKVTYEKAESFEISAELAGESIASSTPPKMDQKEKARILAQKAREDAMRARRESRLREKRVLNRISKPEPAARSTSASSAKPPSDSGVKKKPAQPTPKPAPTPRKTEPAKPSASTAPVVSSIRTLRPGILDGIVVAEDGNKALVTFSTNGMTDYNVTTSAKLSRKWIDIDFPDMAADLPDRIRGGENIVGEVYVVPSGGDGPGVRVSVEILPTRIGYDVYQEGKSLVLKVSKQ